MMTGDDVRIERAKLRMRQVDLARASGIYTTKLSMFENGLTELTPEETARVATALRSGQRNRKANVSSVEGE